MSVPHSRIGQSRIARAMRVIAGTYRSRILKSLKGPALRPTSDYLRETLFNVLGPSVENSRFLDLYAGTGAVGIEAMSRGAGEAVFGGRHQPPAARVRQNLHRLELRTGVTVLAMDASKALEMLAGRHRSGDPGFHHVFLDPPYAAAAEYDSVLELLGSSPILVRGAIVIAEHRRTAELPEQVGTLRRARVLRQGDAALSFYKAPASSPA